MPTPPPDRADLLSRPLIAHLATVRPDGRLQSNPMWFIHQDGRVFMSHTRGRQKFTNLNADPRFALSIHDPERPDRYLEVRGVVERIEDDSDGAFVRRVQEHYGQHFEADWSDRVILVLRPELYR